MYFFGMFWNALALGCAITLHYSTVHYSTVHYSTVHYVTLYCFTDSTLHYITLHHITSHCSPVQSSTCHCVTLHLRYVALHCVTCIAYRIASQVLARDDGSLGARGSRRERLALLRLQRLGDRGGHKHGLQARSRALCLKDILGDWVLSPAERHDHTPGGGRGGA